MWSRRDTEPFALAAASACALGLAVGAWAAPPAYLRQPIAHLEPLFISQEDPNRSRYQAMLAAEGVSPTPYVLAAYPAPSPEPSAAATWAEEDRRLEAELAAAQAEFDARAAQWAQERAAWLEAQRARWEAATTAPAGDLPAVGARLGEPGVTTVEAAATDDAARLTAVAEIRP